MIATGLTTSVIIDPHSPWFLGHFPDDPILPGIAQLKMVADLVTGSDGENLRMAGVSRVKFRKTVRPRDRLDIRVTCEEKGLRYRFSVRCGQEDVCSGKMYFRQNNTI